MKPIEGVRRLKRILLVGLLVAGVAVGVAPPGASGAEADKGGASAAPTDVKRRFRVAEGLDASDGAMAAAREGARRDEETSERYGIDLTKEEAQEVARNAEFRDAVAPVKRLVLDNPQLYGGTWFEPRRQVVLLVGRDHDDALNRAIEESGVDTAAIEIRNVKRSLAELLREADEFAGAERDTLSKAGSPISFSGPRVKEQLVEVGIENLTPSLRDELEARYPSIRFVDRPRLKHTDQPSQSPGQYKTSTFINTDGPLGACTAGYPIISGTNRLLLTAGHCEGAFAYHPNLPVSPVTWNFYYAPNTAADVELIDIPDHLGSNAAILKTSRGANIVGFVLTESIGDVTCFAGRNTPWDWGCGHVTDQNIDTTDTAGVVVQNQTETDRVVLPGDSGGAYVSEPQSPVYGVWNVRVFGIASVSDLQTFSYYSPWSNINAQMNVSGFPARSLITAPVPVALRNSQTNKCMDVYGGSQADNTPVIQFGCGGATNQQFKVVPRLYGWQIVANHSQKCVNMYGALPGDNVNAIQWPCGSPSLSNDRFLTGFTLSGNNFTLKPDSAPSKCLTPKAMGGDNANIVQFTCASTPWYGWYMSP